MVRMLGGGFCSAAICSIILELVLTLIFIAMFMQKELRAAIDAAEEEAKEAEEGNSPSETDDADADPTGLGSLQEGSLSFGGIVFLLCTAFITAALVEEAFKTCIVRW